MNFVETLFDNTLPLWKKAINSPFVQSLKYGNLSEQTFKNYLIQDVLYLKANARAYGKAIYLSNSLIEYRTFYEILGVIDDQSDSVQWRYLQQYNVTETNIMNTEPLPETQRSIDFILGIADYDDVNKIIIAILPCLLSYSYIFRQLATDSEINHSKYNDLIINYAADEYAKSCQKWINFANNKITSYSIDKKSELATIFNQAAQLELNFWHAKF